MIVVAPATLAPAIARVADAAAADDGDRVARPTPPVFTAAPKPAITPHPRRPTAAGIGRVDLGALAGGDEGLLDEGADARAPGSARCRR
jgi:hypothetical protein